MSKNKKSESRGFLRYAIILLIILFLILLFKKDNLIDWLNAYFTINKQKTEMQSLSEENQRLEDRIQNLTQNRDSLELFARQNYFFAQEGDDVFILE